MNGCLAVNAAIDVAMIVAVIVATIVAMDGRLRRCCPQRMVLPVERTMNGRAYKIDS